MEYYTLWLMIFTGVLAVATIFLANSTMKLWFYASEQSNDIKKSIIVAQEAANIAEIANKLNTDMFAISKRPWIRIVYLKLSGPTPIVFADSTINLHISYQLKNVGTTPGADVKFSFEIFPIEPEQDLMVFERLRNVCAQKMGRNNLLGEINVAIGEVGGHLFPDETSSEMSISVAIPISYFEKLMVRKIDSFKSILIIAYVTYKFMFDDTIHITGIPYWLIRKDGLPIFPPPKDDSSSYDGKDHRIEADKLKFEIIRYGHAD